jgi:S1-C subfamily serine protease
MLKAAGSKASRATLSRTTSYRAKWPRFSVWTLALGLGGLQLAAQAAVGFGAPPSSGARPSAVGCGTNWGRSPQASSLEQLTRSARLITVRVLVGEGWGSGILLRRRGNTYRVITNQHVLSTESRYRVQTPDARIYSARAIATARWPDDDLALLEFESEATYSIARLVPEPSHSPRPQPPGAVPGQRMPPAIAGGSLSIREPVFAVGFPFDADLPRPKGFVLLTGVVNFITEKAISGGYRIGYSNPVVKGMSGGALLNQRGEVVGINGRHAYPLWDSPFVFQDGTRPPLPESLMVESSWAIPVDRFRWASEFDS